MTREQAKEILPIIEAFSKGKTVERFNPATGEWEELKNPSFDLDNSCYRIKHEPKCKSFKDREECWNEMLKHQPFGWLRNIYTKRLHNINHIGVYGIDINNAVMHFDAAFNSYTFADNTPFGISLVNMKD